MSFLRPVALAALLLNALTAAEPVKLTGSAAYRERIALEPGSILDVELLDVSRPDAPAIRLSAMRVLAETQVPIRFSLYYDPALIDPAHTYSVSARLLSGDRVLFRSNTLNPVLTRGAGDNVEIMMVRATETSALIGPEWVAEEIAGQRASADPKSHITFTSEGRAHGSGGCNSFNGNYAADAQSFAIGNLASTLRACTPAVMQQETRFHEALRQTRTYKIENGLLYLNDANGVTMMRLAASISG